MTQPVCPPPAAMASRAIRAALTFAALLGLAACERTPMPPHVVPPQMNGEAATPSPAAPASGRP